jgi:hypothetical protein
LLWAGTDDGLVQVSTDDGAHWANVSPRMPEWSTVDLIEASPHDAGAAYVAVDRHKLDDIKPYIYKTGDTGKTWVAITTGLPEGAVVHAVREDPKRRGLLFAGTELGVFVSFDDGGHWQPLQLNLPVSPVHDLVVKDDDLVAATHGRAFWLLDNLTPLRQVNPQLASADSILYQPQTAISLNYPTEFDRRQPVGENPPPGAMIDYYFKAAPKDEVTLDILDSQGKLVRHLSSKEKKENDQPPEWPDRVETPKTIPAAEGMNRFAWDLHYDDPVQTPGAFYTGEGPRGPHAIAGEYQVKLTVAGKTQAAPLKLIQDPRVQTPPEAWQKQLDLALQVRDRITQLHTGINEIRDVKNQIKALHTKFGENPQVKPALDAADDLSKRMSAVEEELIQVNMKSSEGNLVFPNKLNEEFDTFSHIIDGANAAPTQPQQEVFQMLSGKLDEQLKKWAQLKTDELPKIGASIKQLDLPAIAIDEKRDAAK